MPYEYKTVVSYSYADFEEMLNQWAKARWRVVGYSFDEGRHCALMERLV